MILAWRREVRATVEAHGYSPVLQACLAVLVTVAVASCGRNSASPAGISGAPDAEAGVPAVDGGVDGSGADDAGEHDGSNHDALSEAAQAVDSAAPDAVVRGTSAWMYEQRQDWADALRAHDVAVSSAPSGSDRRVAYLFPYAGGVSISGSAYGTQSVWFDSSLIDYYANELPDARPLPIFDSADGVAFAAWSDSDQRQLAGDVADQLLSNAHIAGAQVDIEPFRTEHLPFYQELGQRLHAQNKLLTVFTGASSGDIYAVADIVVLSGYDLGVSPLTPANYTTALDGLIADALETAASANAYLMVGLPITASWEEYDWQSGTCDAATGSTQEAWFSAALAAACPHQTHESYLGIALWGFYGDALEIPRGSGCFRHPGTVSAESWSLLLVSGC